MVSEQYSWPPKDPYTEPSRDRIPSGDPWTFGNGGINPDLLPSNTLLRRHHAPPYHPSYDAEELESNASTSSSPERESHSSNEYLPYSSQDRPRHREGWREEEDVAEASTSVRVRRGSEGLEATMPDRWAQLQEEPLWQEQMITDNHSDTRGRTFHR